MQLEQPLASFAHEIAISRPGTYGTATSANWQHQLPGMAYELTSHLHQICFSLLGPRLRSWPGMASYLAYLSVLHLGARRDAMPQTR